MRSAWTARLFPALFAALLNGAPAAAATYGNGRGTAEPSSLFRGVEIRPVDLSLLSPISQAVPLSARPNLPGALALPAQAVLPEVLPQALEIPALPPSAAIPEQAALINAHELVRAAASAQPTVLASLQGLATPVDGGKPSAELAPRFFDRSRPASGGQGVSLDSLDDASAPRRPRGTLSVGVEEVRDAADVYRLIPDGINSHELRERLVENVATMAPYTIYTYRDAKARKFTAIDLSKNPALVDVLPEQQSHEVKLIKKIQVWNKDLQVLIREDGKTPDLVVGGVVTELKSLIGDKVDFTYLLNKANSQVHEHAERHGLGNGAVVIDLTKQTKVPAAKILSEIETWRAMPVGYKIPGFYTGPRVKKQQIALDKVYVFAGSDLKMFVRAKDGAFRLSEPAEIPFALAGHLQGFKRHQLFLRRGPARAPPPDTAFAHAFDRLYLVKELQQLAAKGRYKRAYLIWSEYADSHDFDSVRLAKRELKDILPEIMRAGRKLEQGKGGRGR